MVVCQRNLNIDIISVIHIDGVSVWDNIALDGHFIYIGLRAGWADH